MSRRLIVMLCSIIGMLVLASRFPLGFQMRLEHTYRLLEVIPEPPGPVPATWLLFRIQDSDTKRVGTYQAPIEDCIEDPRCGQGTMTVRVEAWGDTLVHFRTFRTVPNVITPFPFEPNPPSNSGSKVASSAS